MNILALKAPSALALRPGWPVHLSWLALTAFAILLIFASDAMGMADIWRSEEHTSELQSLMRISYAVFCLKKKNNSTTKNDTTHSISNVKNRIRNRKQLIL